MLKPKSRRQAELDKLKRDAQSRANAKIRNSKVGKAGQGRSSMFSKKTATQKGSKPVQERDTGLGGMTSGGPTTRRKKPVIKTKGLANPNSSSTLSPSRIKARNAKEAMDKEASRKRRATKKALANRNK